jgi:hypothetical protein
MKSFVLLESCDDTRGRKRFGQGKFGNTNDPFSVFNMQLNQSFNEDKYERFQKYERKRNSTHTVFV